jgi:hypothetical protein
MARSTHTHIADGVVRIMTIVLPSVGRSQAFSITVASTRAARYGDEGSSITVASTRAARYGDEGKLDQQSGTVTSTIALLEP